MRKINSIINQIKKDFRFIKKQIRNSEVSAILLFGSFVKNEQTPRSDIDICVVAPGFKTPKKQAKLLSYIWQNIDANKYDVRIFEELPISIKIEVINQNKIIFNRNPAELSYYFYFFRKIWNDQSVNWIEK